MHQQRQRESAVASIAHDVLGAMAVVQAFNREPTEYERFAGQDRKSLRAGLKTTRLESRLYRTVSLASAIGLCAIIFFGARAVLDGARTPGELLVFLAYLRGLGRPMRHPARVTGQLAESTTCGERIAIVGPTGSGKSTLLKLILRTLLKLILRLYDAALGYARPGLRRISLRAPGRRRGGRGGEGAVRIEIRR